MKKGKQLLTLLDSIAISVGAKTLEDYVDEKLKGKTTEEIRAEEMDNMIAKVKEQSHDR